MSEPEVLFAVEQNTGIITLNRPRALNALNYEMAIAITDQLNQWATDDAIHAVIIEGAGEKAFCAGGDVRAVAQAAKDRDPFTATYFIAEYLADYAIHSFPKPYIALMDGIVMGGGCGLSVNGSHRIVTEKTMLAMPETGIGYIPDVGSSHFLNQCPGKTGLYMGLSGARLSGADALWAGLATHFVPSDRIAELRAALISGVDAIDHFAETSPPAELPSKQATIDKHFSEPSVEAIIGSLEAASDPLADLLKTKAPTALRVTFHLIETIRPSSVREALTMEYRASAPLLADPDFCEGIRALLIDKDGDPKWQPATLADVDDGAIPAYFNVPKDGDLPLPD